MAAVNSRPARVSTRSQNEIQAKGRNLLDEGSETTQGGLTAAACNQGRQFSFQAGYRF